MARVTPGYLGMYPYPYPGNPYPQVRVWYIHGFGTGLVRVWRVENPPRVGLETCHNVHRTTI